MPFIPLPDTVGIRAVFAQYGQTFTNNYYYVGDAPWSVADMTTLLTTLEGLYGASYNNAATPDTALVELVARDMSTEFGSIVSYPVNPAISGLVGGDAFPSNVALVVTLRTGLSGRSFRGRLYHGGIPVSVTTGNNVSPAYVTNVGTLYASLITPGSANNPTLVVASRYTNNLPRVTGLTTPVTAMQVNTQVDTQRRRLP